MDTFVCCGAGFLTRMIENTRPDQPNEESRKASNKIHKNCPALRTTRLKAAILFSSLLLLSACAAIPPQLIKTHDKELEIIESLQDSHLAMVDAYIEKKLQAFEQFFFNKYGPAFRKNWVAAFLEVNDREYDESRDFPMLYNDLVAEYQGLSAPIEKIRADLREAITTEYRNAISAHRAVGQWLASSKKSSEAYRNLIDSFLESVKPGLSLEKVDQAVDTAKGKVLQEINKLQS